MSHFAQIKDGIVQQVIVAEQEFINSGALGDSIQWIQTSYNTHGGQHPEGRPLRKNYAGIGFSYDLGRDAFIPPKPFASWVLDEETCLWHAPETMPDDGKLYQWNEPLGTWTEIPAEQT